MRHLLAGMLEENETPTVIDMEAGLEHLSRGTGRHVDVLLVVAEPYFKALETARRCAQLGAELEISRVYALANKFRGAEDLEVIRHYAAAHQLQLLAEIPFDEQVYQADLEGRAPEIGGDGLAARSIHSLTDALLNGSG